MLKGFEPVDLPLRLTVTPRLRDGVAEGAKVSTKCRRKLSHSMNAGAGGVAQPRVQQFYIAASQKATDAHGEGPHFRKLGGGRFQVVHLFALGAGQQPPRFDAQCRRDDRWHGRS
jgi:hypothetical protein